MNKICEICWERPVVYKCGMCGRFVCKDHFLKDGGICVVCSETLCRVCRKNLSITTCPSCGRLVCHSCLIDREGIRICYMCKIYGRNRIFRETLKTII